MILYCDPAFQTVETKNKDQKFSHVDFVPAIDVEDTKEHVHILVDLPGLTKDAIRVDLTTNILTISGEVPVKKYRIQERPHGKFERRLWLPKDIDPEKITAQQDNGVLSLTLAKKIEQKKTISIE